MRLESLVCGLFFLYLQRVCKVDHAVKYCILGDARTPPPPPPSIYTLQTIVVLLLLQVFFKDTLYFLLKYVLPPVLFTLTQVVLFSITSTFTRVQIQSNLGTTAIWSGLYSDF